MQLALYCIFNSVKPCDRGQTERRVCVSMKAAVRAAFFEIKQRRSALPERIRLTLSAAQMSCDGYQASLREAEAPLV